MGVRRFKPGTPGQRHKISNDFSEITSSTPEKSLLVTLKKSGGRNNKGRMTMRYIGGGHKQKYRLVDFKRDKHGIPAVVQSIEYDPCRTARVALLHYKDGEKRYILAPEGLKVNQTLLSGAGAAPEIGNALFLSEVPLGSVIHNVEMQPGRGGILARSAGSFVQLMARDEKYSTVKLPSGETRLVLTKCLATIGAVSNQDHSLEKIGKAGRNRWRGRRPRNRGVSMNPVDHPMGGGEGKASGGHPRNRKGIKAKGFKTRNKKKSSNRFILERRKK